MIGVALPTAALSFALALTLTAGPAPDAQAEESRQEACTFAHAVPISSSFMEGAAETQGVIEGYAKEQKAEAEREEAARQEAAKSTASETPAAPDEPQGQAQPKPQAKAKRTLTVNGTTVSYVDTAGASEAPSSGAGLWKGSDSTTDGSFAYFIGHNPGSFTVVAHAGVGSTVTVVDSDGNSRTYTVRDDFTVPRGTTWSTISERVSGRGESVILQTCVSDGYKILVAA